MIDLLDYDYVVFDCDGVILDSNWLKTDAFITTLEDEPEECIDKMIAYHKANGGISRYKKFRHYFEEINPHEDFEKNTKVAISRFAEIVQKELIECNLIPGVLDFINDVNKKGLPLFVVSGSDGEELRKVFNKRKIDSLFSAIYGSPSTKIQNIPVDRKEFKQGILYGVGSVAMMAFGIVMIKPILNTVSNQPGLQLWIAGYRLLSGVLVSGSIMFYVNRKQNIIGTLRDRTLWLPLIVSSVLAAYLGIAMWVMGMSMTTASISSILNQTATIFIIIFAWIFLGEPLTKRRILSIAVAMLGAYLVFIG